MKMDNKKAIEAIGSIIAGLESLKDALNTEDIVDSYTQLDFEQAEIQKVNNITNNTDESNESRVKDIKDSGDTVNHTDNITKNQDGDKESRYQASVENLVDSIIKRHEEKKAENGEVWDASREEKYQAHLESLIGKLQSRHKDKQEASTNSDKESKESKDKFSVPFVNNGEVYKATCRPKNSKQRTMQILVTSTGRCNILKGSEVAAVLSKDCSQEANSTLEAIKAYRVEDGYTCENSDSDSDSDVNTIEVSRDILDIKVSTAATLLYGRQNSKHNFISLDTGKKYEQTRKQTPQSTQELESYIFNGI